LGKGQRAGTFLGYCTRNEGTRFSDSPKENSHCHKKRRKEFLFKKKWPGRGVAGNGQKETFSAMGPEFNAGKANHE